MRGIKTEETGYLERLLELMDFSGVDGYLSGRTDGTLSFREMVEELVTGGGIEEGLNAIGSRIADAFFSELSDGKTLLVKLLLLTCLFCVFNGFLQKKDTYVSELTFFLVYGAVVLLVMESFLLVSDTAEAGLSDVTSFMQVLVPAYASTLLLSGNAASAGVFYEMTFAVIYLLEWAIKNVVMPAIHLYVLLLLLDHFFAEHRFQKMAELIASCIRFFRKTAIAAVLGVGVVQSMLTPARDRITKSGVLKVLKVLPGVGGGVELAGEVLLGCGMLVKNCVGVAGVVILLFLCMTPVAKVLSFSFLYRLIAAVLEPIGDQRVLGAISGVAKGSRLCFEILLDGVLLFLIAIGLVTASTSFIY